MENIKSSRGLHELPKPCEIFDLIGGTSTGGIIAIMLGRLEMTVDQSIRAYKKLAETAFTEKRRMRLPGSSSSVFSGQNLEHAIKQAIRENCVSPGCIERRNMGISGANTCGHEDMPFYDDALCTKTFSSCKTWEVARATSAATTFFKPTKLGRDEIEFIDAGFGHNNPCERLIAEAGEYCQDKPMLILSIGTGLGDVIEIGKTRKSIVKALKEMATTSKATALRLKEKYGNTKQYYRFNVEDGLKDVTLSDWKQASRISSHTNNYLLEHKEEIRNFVSALTISSISQASTQPTELYSDPSASIQPAELEGHKPVHYIPFNENLYFVGREEVLSMLKGRLFAQSGFQQVALIGLGGMGKTQIALKLAYWVKETKPEYSIFWLTGANISNFDNACKKLVEELKIKTPDNEDSKILMKDYLESKKSGHWLLIIDNADETETFEGSIGNEICHFLPQSVTGRVLFTTRCISVALSAVKYRSNFVELDGMSPEESRTILERNVKGLQESHDTHLISAIAEELCYLPLAIAQAADYICRNSISPGEYLELLRSTEADKIQLLEKRHFDKVHYDPSQGAVITTWIITFKQIEKDSQPAATLLEFISQIDAKAIPQSIFPEYKTKQEMTNAIGVLQEYGFLRRQQADGLFDMHSLVHLTTKLWFESQGNQIKQRLRILEHIASVFPDNKWENRYLWRQYLPHALQVFEKEKIMSTFVCNLALNMGQCLLVDGNPQECIRLFEQVVAARKEALAANDPSLLFSQYELAGAYTNNGQVGKAIPMLEHVAAANKETLRADHPNLLASQYELARAYLGDGQVGKAIPMLEHVVAASKETLRADHPDLLLSQRELARAYLGDGQVRKAIPMLEHVVAVRKETLRADHPDLLASQHELATAYLGDGQVGKAIPMLEHVVAANKETLRADHPDLLASQHELARAYLGDGQVGKAIPMLEHVVAVRKETLRADHPDLLSSQRQLATAYLGDGQVRKAIPMLEHVVAVRKETLGADHPRLLSSQRQLATAYVLNGQVGKAIPMLEHVVAVRKETLRADHPRLLSSQRQLARAYLKDGQVEKATQLS
ncbi:putative acyl transferase acyl hydrolase lysophospholipase [Ceratocystis lukuohia]|uniref:Acyl transferase acyl hydrolase lysophospholipase n=1 Tax=Ceratocystis lukuohia TaxID=2019550 RepID=A0ABR4MAP7_9PEZI